MEKVNPDDFIITRKRKLYKFAVFRNLDNCFDVDSWRQFQSSFIAPNDEITIEVGAGSALFLTKLAQKYPYQKFIAIDRKSDRLQTGAKLAHELGLSNIVYIWMNAHNLRDIISPHSVNTIWITFPDPWPQESNIKHRLTNKKFLLEYSDLLTAGGQLKFKTDNLPLFTWSIDELTANNWQLMYYTNDLHKDLNDSEDATIMTSYEERYTAEGKLINYLVAKPILN